MHPPLPCRPANYHTQGLLEQSQGHEQGGGAEEIRRAACCGKINSPPSYQSLFDGGRPVTGSRQDRTKVRGGQAAAPGTQGVDRVARVV